MAEKLLKKKKQLQLKGNKSQLASICNELAECYKREGKYEESMEEYKILADLYRELDMPMLYAQANRMLGEICSLVGEFEEALTYEKIHLDIARKENNEIEEQRALATIGRTQLTKAISDPENIDMKTLQTAYTSFIQSLELCENLKNISKREHNDMRVRLYYNIGIIKEHQGDFNACLEYIRKGIAISQKHDILEQVYHGYYSLGLIYSKTEDYKESISNFNLALEAADKLEDKIPSLCTTYLAKSEALLKMGELSTAKHLLIKAYKLKTPNIGEHISIENNLKTVAAMCNIEDKLMKTSLSDNKERKKLYESMGDRATSLKIFNRAIFYYEKMKECSEACGESGKDLSPVYISLAQSYKDKKQYKLAYEYFKKDYEVSRSNPEESYTTLLNIALTMELMNGSHDHIVTAFNKARKEANATNNTKYEGMVVSQYIQYLKRKGKDAEITELQEYLNSINYDSDNDSDVEGADNSEFPNISQDSTHDVSIEDLLMEDSDNESEGKRPRRVKKSCLKLNRLGESTLHIACKKGNLTTVKSLLNQHHPVNIRDNCGWLPIHEACNFGHVDVVQELISNGALINDRDGRGCKGLTPLHDACSNGHLEVIELMLDSGASPIILDDGNETPLDHLMSWKDEHSLKPEKETLFNNVVSRMKDALDKVGRNTDSSKKKIAENDALYNENSVGQSSKQKKTLKVLLPKKSPQTRSQKSPSITSQKSSPCASSKKSPYSVGSLRYSVNDDEVLQSRPGFSRRSSFNDKRLAVKRNLNLTADSKKNEDLDVSSATNEYRRAIEGLRNRIPEINIQNSPRKELQSAFVSEEEYNEENWLENDVETQAKKRKKNSKVQQNFFDTNGIRNLNSASINKSKTNILHSDIDQENSDPNDYDSTVNNKSSKNNKRKRSQPSLLESGFSNSRSESCLSLFNISPVTHVDKISSKVHKKQTKLNHFVNTLDTCEYESPVSNHQKENNNQNISKILPVNVRIENKLWRIPVTSSEVDELTIGWLASEAAKRYYKQEGILPSLQLLTQEGAILMNEDPLSMVLLTNTKAEELQSNILSWNLPTLQDRYIEACSSLKIDPCLILKNHFEECERSLSLILRNAFCDKIQLPPFFRTINRQNNLQHLDLSQNNLFNDGVNKLCSILPSLIQLRTLNLSENYITAEGIKYFSEIFKNVNGSVMENLTELNLSFNLFGADTLQYFKIILLKLKLRVFDLCGCNLPENLFYNYGDDFNLNFNHLEYLDLSYNDMNSNDIIRFISFLNMGTISTLNISYNINVKMSGITHELAQKLKNVNKINIKNLNIAKCKVIDSEVSDLLREMVRVNEIEVFNMCFNEDLTSLSLKRLLQHNPSISTLNLLGCSNILSNFDLTIDTSDKNQTNFVKSLKLSVVNGKKIYEINYLIALWKEIWRKKAQVTTLLERTMYFTVEE